MEETNKIHASAFKKRFLGIYPYLLDSKGRVTLPPAYRELLGESFALTVDLDDTAIALYSSESFETFIEEIEALDPHQEEAYRMRKRVAMYSYENVSLDSQQKLLIPTALRELFLGDERDLVVYGALDHACIAKRSTVEHETAEYHNDLPNIRRTVAEMRRERVL